jgi:prepilin-type N-terminal cleavage/methylation domain-containing protein
MSGRNPRQRGFLLTELIVALTVLGILMTGFALSLHAFAQFNSYQLVRQRCIAAAQAELDSMTATGKPVPGEDFERLWPGLTVSIDESPGVGQWQGMKLVNVTTNGKSFRSKVQVRLCRYIWDPAGREPSTDVVAQYTEEREPLAEGRR